MEHLDLVIWLLGYPLMITIVEDIHYWCRPNDKPSNTSKGISALINMIAYFMIAILLL